MDTDRNAEKPGLDWEKAGPIFGSGESAMPNVLPRYSGPALKRAGKFNADQAFKIAVDHWCNLQQPMTKSVPRLALMRRKRTKW